MTRLSRRSLLFRSGAGAAAASLGSLAGCSGLLSSTDSPEPGTALASDREPTYRRWLPSPEAVGDGPDIVGVGYLDARALAEQRERLSDQIYRRLGTPRSGEDALGIAFEDIDAVIQPTSIWSSVVVGSFDSDAVAETLFGTGYEETGSRGEFALFEGTLGQRAAVDDGTVVWVHEHAADGTLEAVIDAHRGEAERLHEHSDAAAALTETIGCPAQFWIGVGESVGEAFEITRANGYAGLVDFDGERTHESFVVQFPEARRAEALDESVFRDAVGDRLSGDGVDAVRTDGRRIRLDETTPTAEFGADVEGPTAPVVTWAVEYDAFAAKVTVEHAAGDPVDADRLTLETGAGDPHDRQFADEYETVDPGDSLSLFTDDSVRILWRSETGAFTRRFDPPGSASTRQTSRTGE